MKPASLFGILALIPAAFNAAPAIASKTMMVPLCLEGGKPGFIAVPLGPADPLRDTGEGCCAKGCHAGSNRKRQHACF